MDFWHVSKLLLARWYIAVPLLLATLAATAYVGATVKPDNVVTSYVQLVPPQSDPDQATTRPINPWRSLGLMALNQAASLSAKDQTVIDKMKADGLSDQFTIELGYPNPVATIEVTAQTKELAYRTTQAVIDNFESAVLSLQAKYNVHTEDLITTQRLDKGENLELRTGRVKRAMIVVFGGGFLLSLALIIAVDAMSRRRKRHGLVADLADRPDVAPSAPPPPTAERPDWSARSARLTDPATVPPAPSNPRAPTHVVAPANPVKLDYRTVAHDSVAGASGSTVATEQAGHDPLRDQAAMDTTIVLPPLGGGRRSGT